MARTVTEKKFKVFGVNRISSLEVTTKTFPYPEDFKLADYYRHAFGAGLPVS